MISFSGNAFEQKNIMRFCVAFLKLYYDVKPECIWIIIRVNVKYASLSVVPA